MKALLSTAGALALIATSAAAQDVNSDVDVSVTLTAEVFEYIAVGAASQDPKSYALAVSGGDVTADNGSTDNIDEHDNNATFTVTSNVNHDINLTWNTWSPDGAMHAKYDYTGNDGACSIGGTVHLDTDLENTGGILSPTTEGELARPYDGTNGVGVPTWATSYGVATEVDPNVTDCPGDIAKPGQYQLGVDITVSKAS